MYMENGKKKNLLKNQAENLEQPQKLIIQDWKRSRKCDQKY